MPPKGWRKPWGPPPTLTKRYRWQRPLTRPDGYFRWKLAQVMAERGYMHFMGVNKGKPNVYRLACESGVPYDAIKCAVYKAVPPGHGSMGLKSIGLLSHALGVGVDALIEWVPRHLEMLEAGLHEEYVLPEESVPRGGVPRGKKTPERETPEYDD